MFEKRPSLQYLLFLKLHVSDIVSLSDFLEIKKDAPAPAPLPRAQPGAPLLLEPPQQARGKLGLGSGSCSPGGWDMFVLRGPPHKWSVCPLA